MMSLRRFAVCMIKAFLYASYAVDFTTLVIMNSLFYLVLLFLNVIMCIVMRGLLLHVFLFAMHTTLDLV